MSKHYFSSGSSVSAHTLGTPEVVDLAQELHQLDLAGPGEQHQQVTQSRTVTRGHSDNSSLVENKLPTGCKPVARTTKRTSP